MQLDDQVDLPLNKHTDAAKVKAKPDVFRIAK